MQKKNPPDNHQFNLELCFEIEKKFAVPKFKLFYPPFCNLMSSPDQILSFLRVNYYLCFFFTTILKLVGQAAGLYLNLKFK